MAFFFRWGNLCCLLQRHWSLFFFSLKGESKLNCMLLLLHFSPQQEFLALTADANTCCGNTVWGLARCAWMFQPTENAELAFFVEIALKIWQSDYFCHEMPIKIFVPEREGGVNGFYILSQLGRITLCGMVPLKHSYVWKRREDLVCVWHQQRICLQDQFRKITHFYWHMNSQKAKSKKLCLSEAELLEILFRKGSGEDIFPTWLM